MPLRADVDLIREFASRVCLLVATVATLGRMEGVKTPQREC